MTLDTSILFRLYEQYFGTPALACTQLAQAGSDRLYYRLEGASGMAIGTYNHDRKENETFIYLAQHFHSRGVKVPQVYAVSEDAAWYLQEDLGGIALYDLVRKEGFTQEVAAWYRKVLTGLLSLQIDGAEGFDFSRCYPVQAFDKTSMFWDLNSFKYYFARPARVLFHEPSLQRDFHRLTDWLLAEPNQFFMMRDCQARNVMLKGTEPYFIDFQGGRKGALQYDVASLLWQAGAKIPMDQRAELLEFYIVELQLRLPHLDTESFRERFYGFLLIRMLQVLSAYGFRGLFEGRSHFIESIPPALDNIRWFLQQITLPVELPELNKILFSLCENDRFQTRKTDGSKSPLVVQVNSFSFKRGLPADDSGNGGGFIFDCRGLHNPGRYEAYKQITGKESAVIEFLKKNSRADEFLQHVWKTIDISLENYIERGFEHLQINFGCTGGQHRSVYCAESTKRYIEDKYRVKVVLRHIEQELKQVDF
jgi:aminoglycoside/choline kinase family phosphotransferase